MGDLRFGLLGPMEISVDGEPVRLPGPAERALLALLTLSPGRTIPATVLIDRLWSESALPADPVNALQIRVSKLRRSMSNIGLPDVIRREGAGYRILVPPNSVDALEFADRVTRVRSACAVSQAAGLTEDHLAGYDDALALWRGDALADFGGATWASAEARRLSELRLAALTERTQIALGLGRHLEVIADLEPLVIQDPTQEPLVGLLMIALYRAGRQADALEAYTRTRQVLDDDLGLEPSLTLRSIHERVLRQHASLGASREVPATSIYGPLTRQREKPAPVPTNLPARVRPLIGRTAQLDALTDLIAQARMVTLIGPGGSGKTSLAVVTASRVGKLFPDGVYGVRLASVNSAEQVPFAVADALGVPLDGAAAERDVQERVAHFLARRKLLLIMDNCEHVVDAAAGLIGDVLSYCPQVTVLATSREALALLEEVQFTVGPLDTPPVFAAAAEILQYPAAELFVERATTVQSGASFDEDALLAIGQICRALDGIPLALELAAARTPAMSPVEISDRLGERFTLLTSGARTAEARQQTLRATVDWSFRLLTPLEQRVFTRLSIFHGGWTLTAAEEVVGDTEMSPGQVVDTIGRLVKRSMIVVEPGSTTRYRMLETLRQYAAEQLVANSDAKVIPARHAQYYRSFAEEAEFALRGRGQREALRRLRDEQPNIRAALGWFSRPDGDIDAALAMAGSLGLFWHLGRHLEGRETLARLLERSDGTPMALARALQAVALVERPRACLVHPHPRCRDAAVRSLEIFEELGDRSRAALSRVLLAVEGVTGEDSERAEALLVEAHEQFRDDGDAWGEAVIGFVRMETALKTGDEPAAVAIGRSTAAAFRYLDDPWGSSAVLYHLGWGLRQFGRYEDGARVLEEAIDVASSAGLYNTVQWALADLGLARFHMGDTAEAASLFDRAAEASEHIGDGAGAVLAQYGHGVLARAAGDWSAARERFTAAAIGFDELETPVMSGLAVAGLARCDEAGGAWGSARQGYERALAIGRTAGEPSLVATALEGLARVAAATDDLAAVDLMNEATQLRIQAVRPAPPYEARDLRDVSVGEAAS